MKKSLFYVLTMLMIVAFSGNVLALEDNGGWLWQKHEVNCTATITVTAGPLTCTQTWDGIKDVCRDGGNLCWGSDCG